MRTRTALALLVTITVTGQHSLANMPDKDCEHIAVTAFIEAEKLNPGMDRTMLAAIGSQSYDHCVAMKQDQSVTETGKGEQDHHTPEPHDRRPNQTFMREK